MRWTCTYTMKILERRKNIISLDCMFQFLLCVVVLENNLENCLKILLKYTSYIISFILCFVRGCAFYVFLGWYLCLPTKKIGMSFISICTALISGYGLYANLIHEIISDVCDVARWEICLRAKKNLTNGNNYFKRSVVSVYTYSWNVHPPWNNSKHAIFTEAYYLIDQLIDWLWNTYWVKN